MYILYLAYQLGKRARDDIEWRVIASTYSHEDEFFVVCQSIADKAGYDNKVPFEIRLYHFQDTADFAFREKLVSRLMAGKVFKGRNYQRDIKAWIERQMREVARG